MGFTCEEAISNLADENRQLKAENCTLSVDNMRMTTDLEHLEAEHTKLRKQLTRTVHAHTSASDMLVIVADEGKRESDELRKAIKRSGQDILSCRQCGQAVVAMPDGLAFCQGCEPEQGGE